MNSTFDFAAAGYDCPADWARLHDLIPADIPKGHRAKLKEGDTKDLVCWILSCNGVQYDRAYDADAAALRNE